MGPDYMRQDDTIPNSVRSALKQFASTDSSKRDKARNQILRNAASWKPHLLTELQSRDARLRRSAVAAIACLGEEAHDAIPKLLAAAKDNNKWVRYEVCFALGAVGATGVRVAKLLRAMTREKDWHLRQAAVETISNLGIADRATTTALVRTLHDSSPNVRFFTVLGFEKLRIRSRAALARLRQAVNDRDNRVRSVATRILAKSR